MRIAVTWVSQLMNKLDDVIVVLENSFYLTVGLQEVGHCIGYFLYEDLHISYS